MLNIGCHLSVSKGYEAIGKDALKIGANTFQIFTRNPRGSKAREVDIDDIEKLRILMKENNFVKILGHAPYTLNISSADERTREFALEVLEDDLRRMEYAIHLNDSKNPIGSRKDRHETIGNGQIGIDAITRIINNPKLRNLPFFLETPNDLEGHGKEINLLKKLYINDGARHLEV